MPKLKSKSSAKKRFRITGTGKITAYPANKSHNLRRRSSKMKRLTRENMVLKDCDAKIIRPFIPYL